MISELPPSQMGRETSKSILLIEDDEDIRVPAQFILESNGYSVWTANHGQEALDLIAARGLPALILLDMTMPVMDGWNFASRFREQYAEDVPLVVMTAASDAEKRAKDIHAAGWISKPFKFKELTAILSRYLN